MKILLIVPLVLLLCSCVTDARNQAKLNAKVAAFEEKEGRKPTPQEVETLKAEALAEVTAEAAAERKAAADKLGETASAFATGNIVAGIIGLIGLGTLAVEP